MELGPSMQGDVAELLQQPGNGPSTHMQRFALRPSRTSRAGGQTMTNKSAPPLDEIDLLVGWRAEDKYLFTKAVAVVREWLLDTEGEDRLRAVLKEILAEAGPPAENRPLD